MKGSSQNDNMSTRGTGYSKDLGSEKSSHNDWISHFVSSGATATQFDASGFPVIERRSARKSRLRREAEAMLHSTEEVSTSSIKEASIRHKVNSFDSVPLEKEISSKQSGNVFCGISNDHATRHTHGSDDLCSPHENIFMEKKGQRKSSKLSKQESSEVVERRKKLKMLLPYRVFVKYFQYEGFEYDLSPRGLINCGNSCYANAVLQCLTFTKPLTIYLLRRYHSRAGCMKGWCLMCELEQHVMKLREGGGALSAVRILSQMQSISRQIGNGSQEDAHEFLRLLVASMQSICLEGLGGENVVDPGLKKATIMQHTFGGHLKSKVKCLRCNHESESYEYIMDLSLEIFGWVQSLEDALSQFTTPEDLDGENKYRCGRCAGYVRAQKQLSIHEAPNILTIVLKRFQEGSYGKINKCITFPDMLDLVPFMTGTDDSPPLYMLYGVVVHLDALNASFSGHYVSYVKDLRGHWFRTDDTEVQPVSTSQVMSEGAYILFYMRSCPRPSKTPASVKNLTSISQKPSRPVRSPSMEIYCEGPAYYGAYPEHGSEVVKKLLSCMHSVAHSGLPNSLEIFTALDAAVDSVSDYLACNGDPISPKMRAAANILDPVYYGGSPEHDSQIVEKLSSCMDSVVHSRLPNSWEIFTALDDAVLAFQDRLYSSMQW